MARAAHRRQARSRGTGAVTREPPVIRTAHTPPMDERPAPTNRPGVAGRGEPIFIHGILPRSGTNFLWDLLLLHPDLTRAREPVNEDLFLAHSAPLVRFVD